MMKTARTPVSKAEAQNIKLLLEKGLDDAKIASIIGRSPATVSRVRGGMYDYMLVDDDEPALAGNSRVDIMLQSIDSRLQSIDSRLYRQNEDMKKAIDQLTGLNTALVELKSESKRCATYLSAIADALNEIKSQQAAPEAPPAKYPGNDFEKWGEVIRRVEVYGDKFIANNMRGVKARIDGATLYLACAEPAKKFFKCNPVGVERIKQQVRNVIGYGVEIKLIDL